MPFTNRHGAKCTAEQLAKELIAEILADVQNAPIPLDITDEEYAQVEGQLVKWRDKLLTVLEGR